MPRGGFFGRGRGFGMLFGMGPFGWTGYGYPYWGRCFRFPWLPRFWWAGAYAPSAPIYPYNTVGQYPMVWPDYGIAPPGQEQLQALLDRAQRLEDELSRVRERLQALEGR